MKRFSLILKLSLCSLGFAFIFSACSKTELTNIDGIETNPTLALALGKTSFLLNDFLKSNPNLKVSRDSSLELVVSQDNILSYSVADIVSKTIGIIGAKFDKNYNMSNINVGSLNQNSAVELNTFANSFSEPMKSLFQNGGITPNTVPAFSQTTNTITNFTDFTEFESLSLISGKLVITIGNNFAFDLQQLKIELIDRANANVMTTLDIGNLAVGEIKTISADLSNKSFSNKLAYRIPLLASSGIASGTTLNNKQTIGFSISSKDLKIKTAKAKIVAQDLVNETIETDIITNSATNAKIAELTIKSARINYDIINKSNINAKITLVFPTLKENGVAISKIIDLQNTNTAGFIQITNAICDLKSLVSQPYNKIPVLLKVSLVPLSSLTNISSQDEIKVSTSLNNVEIVGAKGDFGAFEANIPSTTQDFALDLSLLSADSKKILFDNPSLKLKYDNSFGVPMEAFLDIKGSGALGTNEDLNAPKIALNYPTIAQIGNSIRDSFIFDNRNSNIRNFLGAIPNKITYSGKVKVATRGDNELSYFTEKSKINMGLELRIPIKFSAEDLELKNRIDGIQDASNIDKIESATLKIQYKNDFPLASSVDIGIDNNGIIEKIVSGINIPSATDFDNFGKTKNAKSGITDVVLSQDQLRKLLIAKQIVAIGRVNTTSASTSGVAIYSNYKFDIAVSILAKMKLQY